MFAYMTTEQKLRLCAHLTLSGVLIMPHEAPTILCKGHNLTISLPTLTRCLLKTGISIVYLVGYGMKAKYTDLRHLVGLCPPRECRVLCRYDVYDVHE